MILDLQIACKNKKNIPNIIMFNQWLKIIFFKKFKKNKILTIRLVDKIESKKLNLIYCKKNKPTNILSFPFKPLYNITIPLLGDLIICKQIVIKEAYKQKKKLKHIGHIW